VDGMDLLDRDARAKAWEADRSSDDTGLEESLSEKSRKCSSQKSRKEDKKSSSTVEQKVANGRRKRGRPVSRIMGNVVKGSEQTNEKDIKSAESSVESLPRITGVCYDKGRRVWLGHWHERNKPFRKSFSVAKHGFKGAREKAIQWRRDRENGIPYERPKGACGKHKGVCYNEAQRGWRASWCKDGKEHCKYFSIAKHGAQGARSKAIRWRMDRENGIPLEKPAKRTCDEVKGVCYDYLGKRWQASWSQGGKRISKRFPVAEWGPIKAKEMAIKWRKSRETAVLLGNGSRVEVYWSKDIHKSAGYEEQEASWYSATVISSSYDKVEVEYDVGRNTHFRKLKKENFARPPKGDRLVFRLLSSGKLKSRKRSPLTTPTNVQLKKRMTSKAPRKIDLGIQEDNEYLSESNETSHFNFTPTVVKHETMSSGKCEKAHQNPRESEWQAANILSSLLSSS